MGTGSDASEPVPNDKNIHRIQYLFFSECCYHHGFDGVESVFCFVEYDGCRAFEYVFCDFVSFDRWQTVHKYSCVFLCLFHQFSVNLVLVEECFSFVCFFFFAHGDPYVRVNDVSAFDVVCVIGDGDGGSGGVGIFLACADEGAHRPQFGRCDQHEVDSDFGAADHETVCHIVSSIADINEFQSFKVLEMFLDGEKIGEYLGRPAPRGSGIQLAAACRPDTLDGNWQRLILTHLAERTHPGVLTGAPLADVKITLTAGRAHLKHTEGGDFRQATYRAVRQGLRTAARDGHVALLEPWYNVRLELPAANLGRAMNDLQRMGGQTEPPAQQGDLAVLAGRAPVSELRGYAREVAAYTRGEGRLICTPAGYAPCHNAEAVIAAAGYDPDADTENPADSVFCSHGAGTVIRWDEAPARAHVASGLGRSAPGAADTAAGETRRRRADAYRGTLEQDKELLAIFERTYGPVRRRNPNQSADLAARRALGSAPKTARQAAAQPAGPEYLLVDGYNVIFAWDSLRRLAENDLDIARRRLQDTLCNYAGYRRCTVILVFDAYKVKGGVGSVERYHNIHVVYTREAETADMYIEKTTHELGRKHRVRVVSSDGAEQIIILGSGGLRVSARAFEKEVAAVEAEIREYLT